jgi:isoquinoline 1-oxidoreductase beta subunit
MRRIEVVNVSRREFIRGSAAATLVAGGGLTLAVFADDAAAQASAAPAAAPLPEPSAFVRIGTDDKVTVISKHLEMGQGVHTGLATLVAEELDAAWDQVAVASAPADAKLYRNLLHGDAQITVDSTSIANSWEQLRLAGAAARAMLVAAAAKQWNVPADSIVVRGGTVTGGSRNATFGQLAGAAAGMPVPATVKLKDPKDFVLIGKSAPRKDARAKSNGSALFTSDVRLPGMLTAVVARPPKFGARVKSLDAKATAAVAGVRYVVEVPSGVAVVAADFWAASKGRDALNIVWDEARAFGASSADILAEYKRLAAKPGKLARSDGDAAKAIATAAKTIDAAYEYPYLAQAAPEPLDCVVKLAKDGCEIWNGAQAPSYDQAAVAKLLKLRPEQVKIHTVYAGGSFGRRASPQSDYVLEAAEIARALASQGKYDVPVKLQWTREDDMKGGGYRPAYYHVLKAGIDAEGNVVAWQHRIVGQSILGESDYEAARVKDGIDPTSVDGAVTMPYAIPNVAIDLHSPKVGVPVQRWRGGGPTHNAYSVETLIDELAHAAGKDPVAFRRALLAARPRHVAVLDRAATEAGWSTPLLPASDGAKRGRGVALVESFGTVVAEVVEVSVRGTEFRVDRVVCAVDCGVAVNPEVVRAQMEGGIGYALSAALYGRITLKDGVVEQSNFDDYPVLRIDQMPAVDVHIVASAARPSGVGEPGVPPLAPALANALAAATGRRLRTLPLKLA